LRRFPEIGTVTESAKPTFPSPSQFFFDRDDRDHDDDDRDDERYAHNCCLSLVRVHDNAIMSDDSGGPSCTNTCTCVSRCSWNGRNVNGASCTFIHVRYACCLRDKNIRWKPSRLRGGRCGACNVAPYEPTFISIYYFVSRALGIYDFRLVFYVRVTPRFG